MWKLAKNGEWGKPISECTILITEMEEHLSTRSRHERAHQMRTNLKVRKVSDEEGGNERNST